MEEDSLCFPMTSVNGLKIVSFMDGDITVRKYNVTGLVSLTEYQANIILITTSKTYYRQIF